MNEEIRFIVFCMESYKSHRKLTGNEVLKLFSDYEVLKLFSDYEVFDYLREFYDVLHTTGYNYINNDIDIYLKTRGAFTKGKTKG